MYRVYGDMRSGNCYKIKLLMRFLAIEHEWVKVDVLVGETRKPAFLEKNPNGKIPVLELDSRHQGRARLSRPVPGERLIKRYRFARAVFGQLKMILF